jgi:transcriptional regulator with XRE-family HTH domain
MKKQAKVEQMSISETHRKVLRETREQLGLTQAALEKKARVGKTYAWYLETGTTRSTAVAPFLRLVTALHKEAARGQVPTRLMAGLQRLMKDVAKHGRGPAKR